MKQEYTEKLEKYQDKDYELFLKEKGVLDARQFSHASLLYLNYAIITEKLYSDIGKKNIEEGGKENPFYNSVEILGYKIRRFDDFTKKPVVETSTFQEFYRLNNL